MTKNIGKPCAGKPHARFDEGGLVNATSSLLYLGFRPEALRPAEAAPDEKFIPLRFQVERVEDLGSHRLVYGNIGGVKIVANLSFRISIAEGQEHDFSVSEQDVKRFDPKTGERIRS